MLLMQEFNCRRAKFSSTNLADIRKWQEWLTNDENEPGCTALTDEEITEAVKNQSMKTI